MPYKNIKEVLVAATQYPAAIEAALPAGAPVISAMLMDAANQIPAVPDFPMEIPDLPAPPQLPAPPTAPVAGLPRVFKGPAVEVTPVAAPVAPPSPGVLPRARYLF